MILFQLKKKNEFNDALADLNVKTVEYTNGMKELKIFAADNSTYSKFSDSIRTYSSVVTNWFKSCLKFVAFNHADLSSNLTFLFPLAGLMYLSGDLTAARYIMFLFMGLAMLIPLEKVADNLDYIGINASVAKQIMDLLNMKEDHYETTLTNCNTLYKLGLNLRIFLSLAGGVALLNSGSITPDVYLFFAIMGIIFYRPLEGLMDVFAVLNLANSSLDNIIEFHNIKTEASNKETESFTAKQADIRFENVSFSYNNKKKALENISFTATSGTITALVGPCGSGKTTLLNMIHNFLTPQSGNIYINHINTKKMKKMI